MAAGLPGYSVGSILTEMGRRKSLGIRLAAADFQGSLAGSRTHMTLRVIEGVACRWGEILVADESGTVGAIKLTEVAQGVCLPKQIWPEIIID